jgi:hypothetical protein
VPKILPSNVLIKLEVLQRAEHALIPLKA